ncbi:hypothetical protein HPP92_008921 [Vanilla planifolia]|uniref:Protein arginine N-methyltransferase domain-containing protein n=1 Tax=Vanilla planifolia TaxID=51239 RepID=A0A835RF86_VANPL|nr:hypothetical protein HPP92_008921 [Vanilla planifolia]
MLLTVNPKSVPYRATTYGQLVECTFLWKLHDLHGNEDIVSDGICLTPVALETLIQVKPQQYALHVNPLFSEMHLLSEPFKIFEFDFWKRPDSHGETEILVTPTADGRVNAVVSWWVLQLDCDGSVFYSTAPNWIVTSGNEDHWCDHWKQCVWFIPGKGISVSRNANILLKAIHDDSHVSYSLRADKEACHNLFNFDECRLFLTPERIALYGTKEVRSAWLTAIKNALRHLRLSPLCVVADDSLLLTILAASLSKTSEVISSFHGLQRKGYEYLQAVSTANNFSMDRILVLGKRVPSLLLEDNQREIDLFVAEPFYYGNDGMLPWHNLRFWKDKCMLDPILSKDAIIMPCKGLLRVCAMHLPDLWRSRCYLNEIEGFDHSLANETLGACGNLPPSLKGTCLSYFIWQCGEIKELSEVFLLMEFIFSEPMQSCFQKVKLEFSETGICHGFVLWIDWVLDEHEYIILSTGPVNRYWKQGVKLLSKPIEVDAGSSVEIEASFDPFSGELDLMGEAGDGSENAATRVPPSAEGIANEAKRLVENAIAEVISFKLAVSAAADDVISSARFGFSQILSVSSNRIQESKELIELVKNEYVEYEGFAVKKIKEGIYVAASHPSQSCAIIAGVGIVAFRRPRNFLIRNTRRLFLSEESMLADAESRVNELQQSINLVKNESRKLEERALKAEEELERGRKALMDEGRGVQAELRFVRKIEKEIFGLKDLINELPRREASQYRSAISSIVSQVKQEKKALSSTATKIVNKGIPI